MKKVYTLAVILLFLGYGYSQPLTGIKTIPGDYATIAAAVADVNANGVGAGGVTFNVAAGHTETISATIVLTATGTAANPIVFQKSGTGANPLITAYTGGTGTPATASQDGIFALVGSDYVTIDGIDLIDPNTTNPATMEWGYGLFKASASDGCQYVTIKNCTITLKRVNNAAGSGPSVEGSKAINVVNSTITAQTTALTPTSSAGSNSFNTFRSNTIQNCNYGIVINGFAATAGVGPSPDPNTFLGDLGNEIGGTTASHGNTILNYGGAPSATLPSAGIRVVNQWSINISYNILNNNDGTGVNHPNTLRGIYAQSGTSANATINDNNITIKGGGTTHQVTAIESGMGAAPASNIVSINNNTITGEYLTATSGVFYGIYNISATPTTLNIQNNTVSNISYSAPTLTGTGAIYPIYTTGNNAASTFNITDNTVSNISRTGSTGGTTIGIFVSQGTGGMTINVNNNTVSNMSIDGSGLTSTMYGIQTPTGTITVNNNNVYNLQCVKASGTGVLYGIYNLASPTNETINNNNVYNLTHNGTGIIYGIYHFTTTGTRTMSGNTVYNITGAGLTVAGIATGSSSPSVFNNRIYNIQSTNANSPTVSGIFQGSIGTSGFANIYNNYISEIKAPNASTNTATAPAVRGINITTTTTTTNVYVYYNTIYLDGTSGGTNFGSACIFHTASATATTANLLMRNNIFVNATSPKGTGKAVAYMRSGTALNNYDNSSNNNLFYAGTPGPDNLIFYDGTNADENMSDFKTRVGPSRESASFSENAPFINTTTPPYDLKISTTTPTQIESGGIPITVPVAITTDFEGDPRNATTPDIGADEFDGIGIDLTPPSITYTPLGNGIVAPTRVLTGFATITDASGVNTTTNKPRLYYKKSTDANTFAGNTSSDNGWKFVETTSASSPFDFTIDYTILNGGSVSLGDVIQYFVVAQDLATTPNVGINSGTFATAPTSVNLVAANFPIGGSINSYNIVGTLSGTVTVGTGGDYPTLTGTGGLF
ncbi:MAG: beta strand repeat-containing protein, partial [Thermaurantimonas sp.]